jgi:hypothetical protein
MVSLKKNIARLILRGIGILGIFFGFAFLLGVFFYVFPIPRDIHSESLVWFFFLGSILLLGVYLVRDSYLMLRKRAFNAIKSISGLFALMFYISVSSFFGKLDALLDALFVGEKRIMGDMVVCAAILCSLLLSVLVYLICNKLLKRLWEAAYGHKNIPGNQHSTDKK